MNPLFRICGKSLWKKQEGKINAIIIKKKVGTHKPPTVADTETKLHTTTNPISDLFSTL
jgi:hypothetical protein